MGRRFTDARGIVAAFALGAEGVQIGTAFLACEESGASTQLREFLLERNAGQTALTRGFTGRLARGVKNQLLDVMNAPGAAILRVKWISRVGLLRARAFFHDQAWRSRGL
jgi:NAD(P)H-dependent flavin oxidoreductase YrpB (nitropropane dioxygenase family)